MLAESHDAANAEIVAAFSVVTRSMKVSGEDMRAEKLEAAIEGMETSKGRLIHQMERVRAELDAGKLSDSDVEHAASTFALVEDLLPLVDDAIETLEDRLDVLVSDERKREIDEGIVEPIPYEVRVASSG